MLGVGINIVIHFQEEKGVICSKGKSQDERNDDKLSAHYYNIPIVYIYYKISTYLHPPIIQYNTRIVI